MYEQKIVSMGLVLPKPPEPVAAYVPAVMADRLVYTSGQIPVVEGALRYKGRVGVDLTVDEAYEAAKVCCLNCLSVVKGKIGSLDNIERIVKVTGYVNSSSDFYQQSKVIDGVSDLLDKVFGDAGKHARAAVGVNALPLNSAVEVELLVLIKE